MEVCLLGRDFDGARRMVITKTDSYLKKNMQDSI